MKEADIIRLVAERFSSRSPCVALGIGDDAAVFLPPVQPNQRQLITTDTLIEGVHFDLSYMSLVDLGYKALAVNLSDINAMGGESIAALGTLGVAQGANEADIDAVLDGIDAALQICRGAGQNCTLIGGDTVAAPQWVIGFTVLGTVGGKPLLRNGAQPGDIVWHSGTLGLSGVGLEKLRLGETPASSAHVRPQPPLALGPWLQRNAYATAAQDLSDSLSQVALQLAQASDVGVELNFRSYEFAAEFAAYAQQVEAVSMASLLLAQAEDYELLFTTATEHAERIVDSPVRCTRIGRIVATGSSYTDEHGTTHELTPVGFEHL